MADNAPPPGRMDAFALHAAAAALFVATFAAFGGWLHTVRELNRLCAYQAIGAEALRIAQSAHATAPVPEIYVRKRE